MENVLLVFGGVSYEHDISVVTAFQIFKKCKLEDKRLVLFYVSRDGKFYVCNEKKVSILDFAKNKFSPSLKGFKEVVFVSGENGKIFTKTRFGLKEMLSASTAIFACHGGDGENGKLVTMFERFGFNVSAGSSDALAVCMDKYLFKMVAKGMRIPVVPGFKVCKYDIENENCKLKRELGFLGYPVVMKINSGGSSIGLFIAENYEDFIKKSSEAFELDDEIIVERFIKNAREFNIAILGDKERYEISDIDEPVKTKDVLTFADKYLSKPSGKVKGKGSMENSLRKIPLDLDELQVAKMKKITEKLFLKLGLRGVIRIDFLYDASSKKLYVCEVNAIPGSLAYYFYKKNRIIVNDLIEKLISSANNSKNKCSIKKEFMVDVLSKE